MGKGGRSKTIVQRKSINEVWVDEIIVKEDCGIKVNEATNVRKKMDVLGQFLGSRLDEGGPT